MTVRSIIFDCDGVLVDSEKLAIKALLLLARPYGFKLGLSETMRLFHGKSYQYCFDTIRAGCKYPLPGDYEERYRRLSFDYFKRELKPVKGVIGFINALRVPFCVASSGPRDKIFLNLQLAGLADKFHNAIFSCYDIGKFKPEPDIFLHAAKEMDFSVEDCIVIEDSPTGVQAAVAGGFKVYGLATKHTEKELQEAGAITFSNFKELTALLNFRES
ncbi:haloacid dehalogenase [Sphingobacteriaceae bacterium]|nr:haloacid dehalogenase [Sphingobacteriaceae bacterium]